MPRAPRLIPCRLPGSPAARQSGAWLALLVVAWLLTQALGQAHAVLHVRLPFVLQATASAKTTSAPAVLLSRAFHPQGEAGDPQADGLCRLYGHVAQGDLAAGVPTAFIGLAAFDPPPVARIVSAETAPRHSPTARGPPAAG